MIIFFSILCVLLDCNSCDVHTCDRNSNDFDTHQHVQFLIFNTQMVNTLKIDTLDLSLEIIKDKHTIVFDYKNATHKEVYKINFNNYTGSAIYSNDTIILHFLDKRELVLFELNENISIYKFISLRPGIDGNSYLFFTQDLGLIFKKSATWPIFFELHKHNLDQENIFKLILSFIYNDKELFSNIKLELSPGVTNEP